MSARRVFATPLGHRLAAPGPERRLAELGLELPALRPKAGLYEGWVSAGDLLADASADQVHQERAEEVGRIAAVSVGELLP